MLTWVLREAGRAGDAGQDANTLKGTWGRKLTATSRQPSPPRLFIVWQFGKHLSVMLPLPPCPTTTSGVLSAGRFMAHC